MVIQRWQNLLLLVAAALMACFTFCSLGQVQTTDFTFNFTSLGFTYEGEPTDGAPTGYLLHTWYFFIISLMTIIIPLVGIMKFRNLKLQRKLCAFSVLFIIVASVVGGTLGYTAIAGAYVSWSSLALAPVLALMAVIMAYSRIRSDERKLRSADRIR